jgi:hypothetical protein
MTGPRYTEEAADGDGFGNTLQPSRHPVHDRMPQRPPSAVGRPASARRPGTAPVGNVQMAMQLPVGTSTIGRVPRLQVRALDFSPPSLLHSDRAQQRASGTAHARERGRTEKCPACGGVGVRTNAQDAWSRSFPLHQVRTMPCAMTGACVFVF